MTSERRDQPTLRPGDLLERRYEIEAQVGAGGMGRVFRARDVVTKGTVAIKLMDPDWEADPTKVAFFTQEGCLAARIRDRHLIPALYFGVDEGRRFIVYDYFPGVTTLAAMIAEHGRIPWRRVCDIALQMLYGLDALHQAGVVHGDVSLNNCLWREREGPRDEVFLIDLGCAWTRPPCPPVTGGPDAPPEQPGTLGFIAPELLDDEDADHRSDLWSVGSIMYVLLLCREIDRGEGDGDEPLVVLSPASYLPSIPRAVSDVVMRALAGVEQRYPTAMAMAQAIRTAVADATPRKPRVSLWAGAGGVALGGMFGVLAAWASLGAAPAASSAPLVDSAVVGVDGVTAETTPGQGAGSSPPVEAIDERRPVSSREPSDSGGPVRASDSGGSVALTGEDLGPVQQSKPSDPSETVAARRGPAVSPARATLTWADVERAVHVKAAELRPCSPERYMVLGLMVDNGRARLESLDASPVELPRDKCVLDVVRGLRFRKGGPLKGVVGVKLPTVTGAASR
jgi:serine/threonine-protein kinase